MIEKRRITDTCIALLYSLAIISCTTQTRESQIQTATLSRESQIQIAFSLTSDHFKNTARVKDDSLDTIATISTANGFQEIPEQLGTVCNDNFLRAFIDKKSGKKSFQVYQIVYTQDNNKVGWSFFQSVNFETPSGPSSKPVRNIKTDIECKGSLGCLYVEHIAFDVDETLLRTIANQYTPGQQLAWKFRLNSKSGKSYNDAILPAEIAGLLDRVDEYVSSHGLP